MTKNLLQIDALLPFLERFTSPTFSPGKWHHRPGEMPWFDFDPLVIEFEKVLYDHGWVDMDFKWIEWRGKAEALISSPEDIENADIDTIRKLLTTHVRSERYNEGHQASMFECGHITALLRRLKTLRQELT